MSGDDNHKFNDDILANDGDRAKAAERYPNTILHVLEHLELQNFLRAADILDSLLSHDQKEKYISERNARFDKLKRRIDHRLDAEYVATIDDDASKHVWLMERQKLPAKFAEGADFDPILRAYRE